MVADGVVQQGGPWKGWQTLVLRPAPRFSRPQLLLSPPTEVLWLSRDRVSHLVVAHRTPRPQGSVSVDGRSRPCGCGRRICVRALTMQRRY